MNMHAECSSLLGVNFTLIDPAKLRYSSLSYLKDKTLCDRLLDCKINPETLPLLGTYYGNDKLYHGIDTYRNRLLETGQVRYSFISPSERTPDGDVLSFKFLNSEKLQQLMMCSDPSTGKSYFYDLLQQDALQPRAYELLLKRLTDKFSILTKKCDDDVKKKLTALHGGRTKKEFRMKDKLQQLDGIVTDFVLQILQATPEQRDGELIPRFIAQDSKCFEGEQVDIDKFEKLLDQDPDQCQYWIYHLLEMIMFYHNLSMVRVDLRDDVYDVCVENIKKYSKLLFLLKNYLPMDPRVVQAAIQAAMQQTAGIQEAARQAAALPPPASALPPRQRKDIPASPSKGRVENLSKGIGKNQSEGRPASPSRRGRSGDRRRSRSPSPRGKPTIDGVGQGGGSPKASVSKTKTNPKTRNNRYSKNARTRRHKHKRKQHRNRKNKKTKNKKSNRRTKSKSKKNVTFKRRRR